MSQISQISGRFFVYRSQEAFDFRIIGKPDHRYTHYPGKNKGMKADRNKQIHTTYQAQQFVGGIFLGKDDRLLLHQAGNLLGGHHILRHLHGQEHYLGVVVPDNIICRPGNDLLIGSPAAPFPDGNPHDRPDSPHLMVLKNFSADGRFDRMDSQHRISCYLHSRLRYLEVLQFIQRTFIPDGNKRSAIGLTAHESPGQRAADRPDSLSIQHDRRPQKTSQGDNAEIVIKTAAAGNILQQTAAAGNKQVSPAQSTPNGRDIKPRNCFHAMTPRRIIRAGGYNHYIYLWIHIGQHLDHCRQHCLIASVLRAVVPRYHNIIHQINKLL